MRQAIQTRRILEKLLTRVHMTTDEEVQRNLLRLHGLNLMHNILREYPTDVEVIILVRFFRSPFAPVLKASDTDCS